ncbi:MAG: protein translocase subunit SecF, partial [Gammaproteobacteria bacterium]
MRILPKGFSLDFMGYRKVAMIFSAVLLLVSIASLAVRQLDLGIDFTGGHLIEVGYEQAADLTAVRGALADNGFPDARAQYFGTSHEVLIRMEPRTEAEEEQAKLGDQVLAVLSDANGGSGVDLRRNEFVGPQVGEELREEGGMAMLLALAAILAYVALRFEFRFAVGSVAALAHDVIIVLGFFSLFGFEFDLPVLAAV